MQKTRKMIDIFGIKKNDIVSIVGAGGKTSLMFLLANKLSGKRLVTTSTKIYKPEGYTFLKGNTIKLKDEIYVSAKEELNNGKISGINPLIDFKDFDYVLIEADGAQRKPLKSWSENEPIIVKETNITCGVIDISVLGKPASEQNIFRLDEYKKITDYSEIISLSNIKDIILHKKGLFKNALGKKILYINKVENKADEQAVKELIELLLEDHRFNLDLVIAGSVKEEKFQIKYTKTLISILASGQGSRMGKDKLSMELNGKPLIENVLNKFPDSHTKILVSKDNRLEKLGEKYGFKTIINENHISGQSESIKCAVRSFEASNYMFVLGDQPFIEEKTIAKLLSLIDEKEKSIIACKKGDIISAPAIINRKYKGELLSLSGDQGAKKVIKNHLDDTFLYELEEKEFVDIDTAEDIRKWSD